jgi:DNA-binding transcriptional LysR family regulator
MQVNMQTLLDQAASGHFSRRRFLSNAGASGLAATLSATTVDQAFAAGDTQTANQAKLEGAYMLSLKQAAIGGLGIVALPGYVCRDDVESGVLRQVLPGWIADDSTLTALMPYRQGLLPSIRAFVEHLAAKFPKAVRI